MRLLYLTQNQVCFNRRATSFCVSARCKGCCTTASNPCKPHLEELEGECIADISLFPGNNTLKFDLFPSHTEEIDILRGFHGLDDQIEAQSAGAGKRRKVEKGEFNETCITRKYDCSGTLT